ncbi:LysR family transcriptional regulator [Vibrio tapetis]|uniref:Regulatory protein, LysR:LysR, substrate-binding n=1 Tax=Vibrio tapetis subsp. tapetis TaxID=1671868 RepID=A0A2N8ZL47_9VIBR|nr:LysR family transcriptional regulator [Vibrio tapetis]SON52640.1 Regulatory protein, LysR:LysR, substrate-binding [Vibrio tapetis subsp. tapetis]
MLNMDQLAAFVAAAEKGSFSAAARHLGKSQSSVSIGVNNLELDLGVTLFDRSTKYPTLTPQGERLYAQAKVLIRQAERIQSYAQEVVNEVEGELKIAIDPLVPFDVIDSTLEKLAQQFPYTQIHIAKYNNEQITSLLLSEEVNLGLHITHKGIPDNLEFIAIEQVEWICVCSPDSELADMDEVDNETLISKRQIACDSMMINPLLSATGKISQDIWTASDQDDMVRLVEQGIGWAFLPKQMSLEKLALGTLIEFNPEFKKTNMHSVIDLIWKANAQQGPVMRFLLNELAPKG